MTVIKRTCLMAGASVVALGLLAPGGAEAFEQVTWTWNSTVKGFVGKFITIHNHFDPKGLVMVEAIQKQLGDVTAKSIVYDVDNNAPNGDPVTYEIDLGSVEAKGFLVHAEWNNTGELEDAYGNLLGGYCGGYTSCSFDLGTATITIDGLGESLNAVTDLPEVVSSAVAVGNTLNIESPTMTEFHVKQVTTGDYFFNTANIEADSWVWDIKNASVDSSATAVANSFSLELEAAADAGKKGKHGKYGGGGTDDLIVIGDLNQISHANVDATSFVADVSINNYTNLGKLDRAIVSSVATAVGNAANISVSVGGNN